MIIEKESPPSRLQFHTSWVYCFRKTCSKCFLLIRVRLSVSSRLIGVIIWCSIGMLYIALCMTDVSRVTSLDMKVVFWKVTLQLAKVIKKLPFKFLFAGPQLEVRWFSLALFIRMEFSVIRCTSVSVYGSVVQMAFVPIINGWIHLSV